MAAKIRRHRVKSPRPSPSPYGPKPMAHVGFLESRHLHPERLPSGKKEKVVSLRLIDVSCNTISQVQNLAATIRRLTAASLHLKNVPEDLVRPLACLTKLDLSNNCLGDTSFPDCMKHLEQLVEVRLATNKLTRVPVCITKFKNLKRLDLSDNQIVSCNGLEKLRRLKILVLDNNRISALPKEFFTLRKLDVLRCCGNKLREIPRDIRQLKSLVDLDLSDNGLSILPPDIFMLPKLDIFSASKNEVVKVPIFNIRPQKKRCIAHVDLSDNKLSKFPSHLLLMSIKLDLSNNRIRSIPYHVVKKLDNKTDKTLLIKNNPLCYPPSDICDYGLKSVISFFQETESEVKVYQGIKVLVLGQHGSGKTSFVQTMVDQHPRMSEDGQDSSGGIDVYDMIFELEGDMQDGTTGRSLEVSIWDFCGHPFYMYPHHIFFEQPSVAILTFNMREYSDDLFEEHIGCWFDWMTAKTNKVVAVLVGTQCDKLDEEQMSKVSHDLMARLDKHLNKQTEFIKKQIKTIEERSHISPTLSEKLKTCIRLLQTKSTVHTEVLCTSAKMFVGFDKVRQAIERFAEDRQLFPNVMTAIPTFWLDVRYYIEDLGNTMPFPVMTWQMFEKEVTSRFGMKHLLKSIAKYLHETGQIIWFSNVPTLAGMLFIRPSWLFDVFRSVLRPDLDVSIITHGDHIRSTGLTLVKFERLKHESLSEGVIDKDLLRYLLAQLIPADHPSLTTDIIKLLTEGFQLGFSMSNPTRETAYLSSLNKDSEDIQKLSKTSFPWLRKNSEPEEFTSSWSTLKHAQKLICFFTFPLYFPPGLFEIMCVRAHHEKHKLRFMHQWGGGIHAIRLKEKVHVLITYVENDRGENGDSSTWLKFEVRSDCSDRDKQSESDNQLDRDNQTSTSIMWDILLPLLLDFEQLLVNYSGILVDRLTECPLCQRASFLGEWLTPKETQSCPTRFCEVCRQEVETSFLVQPKEQKRVIIKRKNTTTTSLEAATSPLTDVPALAEDVVADVRL